MTNVKRLRAWAEERASRKLHFRRNGNGDTWIISAASEGFENYDVNTYDWQPIEDAAARLIATLESLGEEVPTE